MTRIFYVLNFSFRTMSVRFDRKILRGLFNSIDRVIPVEVHQSYVEIPLAVAEACGYR